MKITKKDLKMALSQTEETSSPKILEAFDQLWTNLKVTAKENKKQEVLEKIAESCTKLKERLSKGEKIFGYFTDSKDYATDLLSNGSTKDITNFGMLVAVKDGKFCQSGMSSASTTGQYWNYFIEVKLRSFSELS